MKILVISDMTAPYGGAYKYLKQLENFISSDISITSLLEQEIEFIVKRTYFFQTVEYTPLSHKFHSEYTITKNLKRQLHEKKPDQFGVLAWLFVWI